VYLTMYVLRIPFFLRALIHSCVLRWGPSEFFVSGTLRGWSIVEECHRIPVPTLITNGRLDEATDEVVMPFVKNIPGAKWVQFANSVSLFPVLLQI
jgi:hypothetical protein